MGLDYPTDNAQYPLIPLARHSIIVILSSLAIELNSSPALLSNQMMVILRENFIPYSHMVGNTGFLEQNWGNVRKLLLFERASKRM